MCFFLAPASLFSNPVHSHFLVTPRSSVWPQRGGRVSVSGRSLDPVYLSTGTELLPCDWPVGCLWYRRAGVPLKAAIECFSASMEEGNLLTEDLLVPVWRRWHRHRGRGATPASVKGAAVGGRPFAWRLRVPHDEMMLPQALRWGRRGSVITEADIYTYIMQHISNILTYLAICCYKLKGKVILRFLLLFLFPFFLFGYELLFFSIVFTNDKHILYILKINVFIYSFILEKINLNILRTFSFDKCLTETKKKKYKEESTLKMQDDSGPQMPATQSTH